MNRRRPRIAPLGLLLAAGLLAGCDSAPRPSGDSGAPSRPGRPATWRPAGPDTLGPVLAIVGGRRITRHDVDSLIALAPPGIQAQFQDPDQYRLVVNRMVDQEVVYQAALREGTEKDSVYQHKLAESARDLLLKRYYQIQMDRVPAPDDSLIRGHFEENIASFRIPGRARLRHIQVDTEAKAKRVLRELRGGGLWDAVCKAESKDKLTSEKGGLIGYVTQETDAVPGVGLAPAIVAAAFDLEEGSPGGPVKSERGWHVIQVESREPETTQSFETVKPRIREELWNRRREERGRALLDSLKEYTGAVVFGDSIEPALNPIRSAEDYFKEAQAALAPLQRIELYRALIDRFPQDKVAEQARFMIGFTYAEEMAEYETARAELRAFLEAYPNSDLGESARWMIENMDKPAPPFEDEGTAPDAPAEDGSSSPKAPDENGKGP